jgi:hypothetical protein
MMRVKKKEKEAVVRVKRKRKFADWMFVYRSLAE